MLLEAQDIGFCYRKSKPVLNGISLTLECGQRTALVGPSGCGKSTLSQILAGFIMPQSGKVLFDGKNLPGRGFCPVQLVYQHPEKAINPRKKLKHALFEAWSPDEGFLSEMGIAPEWLERYPTELSGGELQRFCIARALAPPTRFIIADEMTTMLDVITQAQIWEFMLRQIERRGLGLLAVTHNPELAKRICSRTILFEDL